MTFSVEQSVAAPQTRRESEAAHSLPWRRTDTLFAGLQVFLIAAVYARTLRFDFVFDDFPLILQNPLVLAPLKSIPRMFAEGYFQRIFPQAPANDYRPMLSLWLLVNQKLWGFNPAGWHIAPIILHAAAVLGVYLLGRRFFQERAPAALAALVFALHPVHVETTAWVIGMNESLMAVPFLGAFLAFLRSREGASHRRRWVAISLAAYAVALCAKEDAIVLPALVAAWVWFCEGGGGNPSARVRFDRLRAASFACGPYIVLSVAYLAIRFAVLHGLTHAAAPIPFMTLVWTAPLALWSHMRLLLWPAGLSIFYDVPYVASPLATNFLLPAAALAALVAMFSHWGRRPRVYFLAIWLIAPLLPLADLRILPEGEFVHDRYLYLSSIAFALLVAMAVEEGAKKAGVEPYAARIKIVATAAIVLIFGGLSFYYAGFWANNISLFIRGVTISPGNNAAVNNLANEFVKRGRYEEAAALYEKVISRAPNFWLADFNLGVCDYKMGRYENALTPLSRAAALDPSEADVYVYSGLSLYRLGRLPEAESALRRAIVLEPSGAGYHLALGMILKARGFPDQAISEFRQELAYHPEEAAARREITALQSKPGRDHAPKTPF